ncbi:hypothetical protein IAQ67_16005 [Paenibacillus peoriae]|uniref:Uncharacterized protein n=1 Tax=Paenibacillus peoriae TaxID=59893 RepID=A0A7H0Y2T9_9BACL|nr:hypothetical protein [Paenibacillus peoriae]QNR65397.1 hypothetical protein IAQ67_16005 [Paenibacillus peoriae]
MAKIAIVKHNGSQTPYAFYTEIIDLKKDDLVVCDTQRGYETGRVLRISDSDQGVKPTRWIVSKVDTKGHVERVEKEKRISYLKQQIDIRRNEFTDVFINLLLSQNDKAMYSLLKELNELTNNINENKNNVELKDSFHFKDMSGKTFRAYKNNDCYVVLHSSDGGTVGYFYTIKSVKENLANRAWELLEDI